jgi:TonB family protein
MLAITVISLINCHPAVAQDKKLERQLTLSLQNRVLSLRRFPKDNHLQFDLDGQLKTKADNGSWTIYSQFVVRKVDVNPRRVRFEGVRVVHHYDRNLMKLVASPSDLQVTVDVDAQKDATLDDISATMRKVFMNPESLSQYVAAYWRPYLGGKKEEDKTFCSANKPAERTDEKVLRASVISQVKPQYPADSKSLWMQGVVEVDAEINQNGDVGNIFIKTPAGGGLDESAVEAVSQWKYKPALSNGTPVCVLTTLTVNYAFSQ